MSSYKEVSVFVVFMLIVVGLAYVYVASPQAKQQLSVSGSEPVTYQTRDFERNVYIVEPVKDTKIAYSVVQGKNMKATLNGLYPAYVLVKKGETVKFNLRSDVNCNFFISGYGINAKVWPDTTTEVAFNADLPGVYAYGCKGFLEQKVGLLEVVN